MGYNTTIVILNDHLGSIEDDPQFGRKVAVAVRRWWCEERPVDGGSFKVIAQDHADGLTAVLVGGNTGRRLGYAGDCGRIRFEGDDVFDILSALADEHGFKLNKKRHAPVYWTLGR